MIRRGAYNAKLVMTGRKYRNIPTVVNGIRFDSRKEANRYKDLLLAHEANEIEDLETQPVFQIEINGKKVCKYVADFRYRDRRTGEIVVEDVKGVRTQVYKLKKKLLKAAHGVDVVEI